MDIEQFKTALENTGPVVLNNDPQTQVSMFDPVFVGDAFLFWFAFAILIASLLLSLRKDNRPIASIWALVGIGLSILLVAKNW